ncbi:putative membrane protein (TIGR04086 family) [Desulfohalotomaculum tongense]|uniref:TIGR04086 family membrane protein n=1 Tax=Desulforadius tongensis TaxID=1216062 RepID=UPI001956E33F|nr:TIGR04086 family membrane protein [Desulforadius tongensis]MBM7854542.1 putative membrane protein (TIGR04086 family) [Desulforadius tongensis]
MKRLTFLKWSSAGGGREKTIYFSALLLGLVWALSISAAVITALGLYVITSAAPVYNLSRHLMLITAGAVVMGGLVCGALVGRHGLLHGWLVGSIYALFYAVLTVYWGIYHLEPGLALNIMVLMAAGGAGGIVGVNLPGSGKKRRASMRNY